MSKYQEVEMKVESKSLKRKPYKNAWKLELNENRQIKYKIIKESLLECVWRQGTAVTAWLGQREWIRLGRICDMEIGYNVSSISEFRCENPLRSVFGVFIL